MLLCSQVLPHPYETMPGQVGAPPCTPPWKMGMRTIMAPHHKGEDLQELAMLARLIRGTATTIDRSGVCRLVGNPLLLAICQLAEPLCAATCPKAAD